MSWLAQNRRLVAMFIFGWALLDLTVPGLCLVETVGNKVPSQYQESQVAKFEPSIPSSPTPQPGPEDDCWCCCGHVTPAPTFAFSPELVSTVQDPVYREELVYAAVLAPYHPPRS